ncbi:ribonuclease H-like protein [Auriscalpium vulgare]|uniref:Ribonuclease H-like protein n=1 Tax=Auriscalpium vulgare TaxID=40419 RepID=A0ACB8R447_9AGAM|nr:ribonuclease H-like protein [Auriscalpium vulgare]
MTPASRLTRPAAGVTVQDESVTAYTDGSCTNNGKANAQCGSGVWVADGSPMNRAFRVPGPLQSNQVGEVVAIILALQVTPHFAPLHIISDSRYAIDGLTHHLQSWEDAGWIGVANAQLFATAAYLLRRRSAVTTFKWVKGHTGDPGNEKADALANEGANRPTPDVLDLTIDPSFLLTGAKLSAVTQALAYKKINALAYAATLPGTTTQLHIARDAAAANSGALDTDSAMWTSQTHRDIPKPIQQFLFRATHRSYKIGAFWLPISGYEERAICAACHDPVETMEHILSECPENHQHELWKLAKHLWPHGDQTWPQITLGTVLAAGRLEVRLPNRDEPDPTKPHKGASRLLKILISETARLIWVLRCDRAINGTVASPENAARRWHNRLTERLITDRIVAMRKDRKSTTIGLLQATWQGTLADERALPPNWAELKEVLVGIKLPGALLTGHT